MNRILFGLMMIQAVIINYRMEQIFKSSYEKMDRLNEKATKLHERINRLPLH